MAEGEEEEAGGGGEQQMLRKPRAEALKANTLKLLSAAFISRSVPLCKGLKICSGVTQAGRIVVLAHRRSKVSCLVSCLPAVSGELALWCGFMLCLVCGWEMQQIHMLHRVIVRRLRPHVHTRQNTSASVCVCACV